MRLLVFVIGLTVHGTRCEDETDNILPRVGDGMGLDIAQERHEVEILLKGNDLLRQETLKLKKDCDETFKVQWNIYNDLLKKIKMFQPGVEALEKSIAEAYERHEELENAIETVKNYTRIFKLKRKTLQEDLSLLEARQGEYELCKEFGSHYNFEHNNMEGIGTRSLSRKVTHKYSNNSAIEYEKKMLRIKIEHELYRNQELKKYKVYFVGFCSRRLENIMSLIEYLKKYPEALHVDELKDRYQKISKQVEEAEAELQTDVQNLIIIIREIQVLQRKYNILINVGTCFKKLSDHNTEQYLEHIERILQSASKNPDQIDTLENTMSTEGHQPSRSVTLPPDHHRPETGSSQEVQEPSSEVTEH